MLISVFDFESTGADVNTARVVEMAVAVFDTDTDKMVESFSSCIYDETYTPMDPIASKITGVTDDFLKRYGKPPALEWLKFVEFINKGEYCMGHNIRRYDIPLAVNEFSKYNISANFSDVIDTRFDPEYPEHIETRKLAYLAHEFGIIVPQSHAALADVITSYQLFKKFDSAKVIERSKSPEVYVKAHVDYDNKDKAKAEKFFWDGNTKSWMKLVKECDLGKIKGDFKKEVITNYKPPN